MPGWAVLAMGPVAALYAAVGHGGASGYLAVLALAGLAAPGARPSVLGLNLLVAALSFEAFRSAGHFRPRLFWPFALASVPMAFLGGWLRLPARLYAGLLAVSLVFAAWRLFAGAARELEPLGPPKVPVAAGAGAGLGLLSGMVGVGGGIFLSPLMILLRWGRAQEVAAVSALFIWVNSAAGLAGQLFRGGALDAGYLPAAGAALVGGLAGSRLGSRRLGGAGLRRLLSLVLLLAAGKLVWMAGP